MKFFLLLLISVPGILCCGRRIFGGCPINITYVPYIALLYIDDVPFCGASIISNDFVITAAHCVEYEEKKFEIRIGIDDQESEGERIAVKKVFIHPSYEKFQEYKTDYDFALLRIEKIIKFPKFAKIVKLADESDELNEGDKMLIAGWGKTSYSNKNERFLRAAVVPIIDHERCHNAYDGQNITKRMICAGYEDEKVDACHGKFRHF